MLSDIDFDSDDYDEEDDGDELFWMEDEAIDIADDMAQHSVPSPVFYESPQLDSLEGFSDWENLSDDYYDDDPSALRTLQNFSKALPRRTTRSLHAKTHSGRSFKTSIQRTKTSDAPKSRVPKLEDVLWRSTAPELIEEYTPGQLERVALLKNWRDVFRDSKPRYGTKRQRISTISSTAPTLPRSRKGRQRIPEMKSYENPPSLPRQVNEMEGNHFEGPKYKKKLRSQGPSAHHSEIKSFAVGPPQKVSEGEQRLGPRIGEARSQRTVSSTTNPTAAAETSESGDRPRKRQRRNDRDHTTSSGSQEIAKSKLGAERTDRTGVKRKRRRTAATTTQSGSN
ncbi:MAG: hypothetical protein Q9227_004415 [Pyrenula ochraceoflavens]